MEIVLLVSVLSMFCCSVALSGPALPLQERDRRLVAASGQNLFQQENDRRLVAASGQNLLQQEKDRRLVAASGQNLLQQENDRRLVAASGQNLLQQEKDRRLVAASGQNLLQQIVTFAPKPYQFGYELEDGYGMSQYRSEASDGTGVVKGSYGYMDPAGVYRKVEYTADNNGYRAIVRSNEPGTANQNVADALFIVEPPPASVVAQGLPNEISPRDLKS